MSALATRRCEDQPVALEQLVELIDVVLVRLANEPDVDADGRATGLLCGARDDLVDGRLKLAAEGLAAAARLATDEWPLQSPLTEEVCEISRLAAR